MIQLEIQFTGIVIKLLEKLFGNDSKLFSFGNVSLINDLSSNRLQSMYYGSINIQHIQPIS